MFAGLSRNDWFLFLAFTAVILLMPIILQPIGAAYPALMQKMCIFGLFAIGFNILFGLTYLSTATRPSSASALCSSLVVQADDEHCPGADTGGVLHRYLRARHQLCQPQRSGIYFSILTLASPDEL